MSAAQENLMRHCFFLVFLLVLPHSHATAQDEQREARWDDKSFGITIGEPEKGRRWVVVDTVPFTSGSVLKTGDEIFAVNRKRISLKDDLIQIMLDADDTIEIRASRKVNGKTVRDTATFTRTTRWESVKAAFDIVEDPFNEVTRFNVKAIPRFLADQTHLLPEVLFKDGHPTLPILHFQYRADDWLFVQQLSIKYGAKKFVFERDLLTGTKREVLSGGGIKEWFSLSGDQATALLEYIGDHEGEQCTIRLDGKDYYKDVTLSVEERAAFRWASQLWKFGHQRHEALTKTK